ncbi:acyl carrier protein [Gloeocapsa sp. PCC 73106]|uniref:acyl carrier protein n=1 Tax=Gloeocapsa sp. PCC 73106 TaxID=102232 RepID=UPI0002AC1154|nr:acyl carrier protein [Gloeocapsa sp. PCC 73106]ELR96359.1 acyl carrier protein [Gloeocapsa sp. PCC 73106]
MSKEIAIKTWLVQWIAKTLELPESEINTSNSLLEYNLSSMTAMMIVGDLEQWLKIEIVPTLIWDYTSIDALTQYLATRVNSLTEINTNSDSLTDHINVEELSEEEIDALLAKMLK